MKRDGQQIKFRIGMRVLILYPNISMSFALPHSIAIISACLKKRGCIVKLFDATLYKTEGLSNDDKRVIRGQFPHVDIPGVKESNMFHDFRELVDSFNPELIMVSFVDNTIEMGVELLKCAPGHIPVVAGGVGVICNPNRFREIPEIDVVWVGRAEDFILGKDAIVEHEDFSIFEEYRLYHPFSGKLYKTIPWHTERICPYDCGFCCAKKIRESFGYEPVDIDRVINELKFQIDLHDPEFIHITSETFLGMSLNKLKKFADFYKHYNIPFWCQSHVNTITEDKIRLLSDINCFKIALGIECGNEHYRKYIVKKNFSNEKAKDSCERLGRYGIRVGLNSIIGLPFETKDLIWETISLNQDLYSILNGQVDEIQVNGYLFQPFFGTELRDISFRFNLLYDNLSLLTGGTPSISNPFIPDEEMNYITLNFTDWVKTFESREQLFNIKKIIKET